MQSKGVGCQLLVSFCNVPYGQFQLGVYDFDLDDLAWVDLTAFDERFGNPGKGIDCIYRAEDSYWILPQVEFGGVSSLCELDFDLKVRQTHLLKETADAHHLIPHKNGFLITDTQRNRVLFAHIEGEQLLEKEYWRGHPSDEDALHINGIARYEGDIYVSNFGPKPEGGWSSAQEGSILNVDKNEALWSGLKHPHSPTSALGALWWLESKTGVLFKHADGKTEPFLQLEGYVRGLAFDDKNAYIGVSARRRISRSTGAVIPTDDATSASANCGVYRVNLADKTFEYRPLTLWGSEIYDVEPLAKPFPMTGKAKLGALQYRFAAMEHISNLQTELLETQYALGDAKRDLKDAEDRHFQAMLEAEQQIAIEASIRHQVKNFPRRIMEGVKRKLKR